MKRVKIETAKDLESLPEDEWVFVPEGTKFEFVWDTVKFEKDRIIVTMPTKVAPRFRPKKGVTLKVRVAGRRLIVERRSSH